MNKCNEKSTIVAIKWSTWWKLIQTKYELKQEHFLSLTIADGIPFLLLKINALFFLWPYVSPSCLLYSFYDAFFNVFIYIFIGFLHTFSLDPYKYSLAGFSIYIDDDSR